MAEDVQALMLEQADILESLQYDIVVLAKAIKLVMADAQGLQLKQEKLIKAIHSIK